MRPNAVKPSAVVLGIMRRSERSFDRTHHSGPLPQGEEGIVLEEIRALVGRCLAGDQTAMVALVECYQGQVYGLCYRMLGHRQDAEDAAQETLVRAFRSLGGGDKGGDFLPWLWAIAGNRCRPWLSQRVRRPKALPLAEPVPDRAERTEKAK